MDPLARYRRRLRRLPDPTEQRTLRMPVQRRDTRPLPDVDLDEDDTPDPDTPSAPHRRRWLGDPEDDRTEREIRDAIRAGGWPEHIPDPADPGDRYVAARPVAESDIVQYANLVARRQSRLDAVILRDRLLGWFDISDTKYREPLDLLLDVVTVLDEVIENKGGREPEPGQ